MLSARQLLPPPSSPPHKGEGGPSEFAALNCINISRTTAHTGCHAMACSSQRQFRLFATAAARAGGDRSGAGNGKGPLHAHHLARPSIDDDLLAAARPIRTGEINA